MSKDSYVYDWNPLTTPISVVKLIQRRKAAGLTQQQLAGRVNDDAMSHGRIREIEAGIKSPPSGADAEVLALAKALGCGVFDLFEYPPGKTPKVGPTATRLQELRRKAGLPAISVATFAGIGESKLSNLERGVSSRCRDIPTAEARLSAWWGEPWDRLVGPPLEGPPARENGSGQVETAATSSEALPEPAEPPESADPEPEVHVNGHDVLPLAIPAAYATPARDAAEVMLDEVLAIRAEMRTMCADLVDLRHRMTSMSELIQSVNRAVHEQGEALKRQFGGIHGRLAEAERKIAAAAEASAPIRHKEEPINSGPWKGATAIIPSRSTGHRGIVMRMQGGAIIALVETEAGMPASEAKSFLSRDEAVKFLTQQPLLTEHQPGQ